MRTLATGGPIRIDFGQVEAAFKKAPGNAFGIQQVAYVLPAELHQCACGCGAHIADRISIADKSVASGTVFNHIATGVDLIGDAVGLAGDEIDGAWSGGSE